MNIIKEDANIIVLENNSGIKLDTKNKNVFVLIWNMIEGRFNEVLIETNYYKELKSINIPKKEEYIEMNKVVYSATKGDGQLKIMNLLKKYDKENYKPFDHKNKKNISLSGLTKPHKEEADDYLYMMDNEAWIEENASEWNDSYDQLVCWYNNEPLTCWRVQ